VLPNYTEETFDLGVDEETKTPFEDMSKYKQPETVEIVVKTNRQESTTTYGESYSSTYMTGSSPALYNESFISYEPMLTVIDKTEDSGRSLGNGARHLPTQEYIIMKVTDIKRIS